MSKYAELQTLREEEKSLLNIANKLQDQLNRLKIEELALQSLASDTDMPAEDTDDLTAQQSYQYQQPEVPIETYNEPLQLAVPHFQDFNESEEETKSENGDGALFQNQRYDFQQLCDST